MYGPYQIWGSYCTWESTARGDLLYVGLVASTEWEGLSVLIDRGRSDTDTVVLTLRTPDDR